QGDQARQQERDEGAGPRAHEAPGGRGIRRVYGPARGGPGHARSTRSITTGATTISMVKGTATDESVATTPPPHRRAGPAAAAGVGRWVMARVARGPARPVATRPA